MNLIDHTIEVINEGKCLKHLDFSPEGLRELRESHQIVLSSIETLHAYLSSTDAKEKKELTEKLLAHQKRLLTAAESKPTCTYCELPMMTSNAIETDAIASGNSVTF